MEDPTRGRKSGHMHCSDAQPRTRSGRDVLGVFRRGFHKQHCICFVCAMCRVAVVSAIVGGVAVPVICGRGVRCLERVLLFDVRRLRNFDHVAQNGEKVVDEGGQKRGFRKMLPGSMPRALQSVSSHRKCRAHHHNTSQGRCTSLQCNPAHTSRHQYPTYLNQDLHQPLHRLSTSLVVDAPSMF
jgi:hypothetical protein